MPEYKGLLTELGEAVDRYRASRRAVQSERDDRPPSLGRLGRVMGWFLPNGGTLLLVGVLILSG